MHGVWGYVGCRDSDLGPGIVLRLGIRLQGLALGLWLSPSAINLLSIEFPTSPSSFPKR